MKATLRRNGKMMFTLTINQAIGLNDIQEVILSEQGYNDDCSVKPFKEFKSKVKVIDIVKSHMTLYGCEIDYLIYAEIITEFKKNTLENDMKLFPELKETKNDP